MNIYNELFLQEVFYKYWMTRVPQLEEDEAIDHLEWELRNMGYIPDLDKKTGTVSKSTKRALKKFLKSKKIRVKGKI